MIVLPTFRQLRYLQALHEQGHFGRAAEICNVTQSTLSAGLAELETLLGVQLVERSKRHVLFTKLGEEVARRGAALLLDAEAVVALVRSATEPLTGPLRLGVIPTIAPYLLPRLVLPCKRQFPKLRLYLQEEQTARLVEHLLDGRLDAGLLALPYPTAGLALAEIGDDPFLLACPAEHPLAAKDRVSAADLVAGELLLLEDGHCLRDHVLAVCHLPPTHRQDEIRGTSLPTVIQMVAAGLGVTLLPRLAVEAGAALGLGLVTRPLADTPNGRRLALAWRASSPRGAEFAQLAHFIATIAAAGRE
jgi:LysR family hydrogen peroxide-inducible transcriptional activator